MLSESVVTHWGISGQPDGWMSRSWALVMFFLINGLILAMYLVIPKIEPKKKNMAQFRGEYKKLILWIGGYINYVFLLTLLYNLGVVFDMGRLMIPALGVLFVSIGKVLPKTKQNFFVGIRTPWTLSSEKTWNMTHVLGGWLFEISGLIIIFSVFLTNLWRFWLLIGLVTMESLGLVVYSWRVYTREAKK